MLKYAWNRFKRNVSKYQIWLHLQTINRRDIRGLMLPWMVGMFFALLFQVFFFKFYIFQFEIASFLFSLQLMFGMWLIFGYYIYLEVPQRTIVFIWFCFEWYSNLTLDDQKCCQKGVFAALVDFAWLAYNTYCWQVGFIDTSFFEYFTNWSCLYYEQFQVVRNHYRNVKWFQSPDIEVLDEFVK